MALVYKKDVLRLKNVLQQVDKKLQALGLDIDINLYNKNVCLKHGDTEISLSVKDDDLIQAKYWSIDSFIDSFFTNSYDAAKFAVNHFASYLESNNSKRECKVKKDLELFIDRSRMSYTNQNHVLMFDLPSTKIVATEDGPNTIRIDNDNFIVLATQDTVDVHHESLGVAINHELDEISFLISNDELYIPFNIEVSNRRVKISIKKKHKQ